MTTLVQKTSLAAVALVAGVGMASAATFVEYTASGDGTPIVDVAQSGTITLPGFVPGSGGVPIDAVLSGVTVSFDGTFSGDFVASLRSGTSSGSVSGANGFIQKTVIGVDNNGISFGAPSQFFAGTAFGVDLPPEYVQDYDGTMDLGPFSPGLAPYDGVANVSWQFFFSATDNTSASDGVVRGLDGALASLDGTVRYDFTTATTVIPLPAAGWLLLSGIFGLGGLGWYRRRNAA